MKVTPTAIPDVVVVEPHVFSDERGFFFESYNLKCFEDAIGRKAEFVQDNHSKSSKGVLRGMHYQISPFAQAKLVRVIDGEILDVAVDIRKNSSTFGHWVGEILSASNKKQLWIPEGFAHGFLTLSDTAELLYKTTSYYAPDYERTIAWNDAELMIGWNLKCSPKLSSKDAVGVKFSDADVFE